MPSIGTFEIFTILIVVLLLFGPAKLPEVGRQIGKAMREVRRVESSLRSEWSGLLDEQAAPSAPAPTLPPKATSPVETREEDERADPGRSGGPVERATDAPVDDRPAGAGPAVPGEDRPAGAPPTG